MRIARLHPGAALVMAALAGLCLHTPTASAYEIYEDDGTALNGDFKWGYGAFVTKRNYVGRSDSFFWQEGYASYGFNGHTDLTDLGTVYGSLTALATMTKGDGDPGGYTNGHEHRIMVDDGYLGWRSADLFPAWGKDGIDLSVGSQALTVGNGFLVKDDRFSTGKAIEDGKYDRGGAYYMAARTAFAHTAVLRLGGTDALHGSLMWIKSNARIQAKTAVALGTLDYTGELGTLGLTYVRGLDLDPTYATPPWILDRKGMKIYSVRGDGDAGLPDTHFEFEFAHQKKVSGNDNAWYGQAGYTFSDVTWQPEVSLRHARYSTHYDPLFQGPFGMRRLGEVAANYSSSYGPNTRITDILFRVHPTENVAAAIMYFNFKTLANRDVLNLDARELTLYLDWMATKNIGLSSMIGVYKPRYYASNGGNQSGTSKPNPYLKLMVEAVY